MTAGSSVVHATGIGRCASTSLTFGVHSMLPGTVPPPAAGFAAAAAGAASAAPGLAAGAGAPVAAAKACFVAKKRTIGDVRATREELFDGAMQPDQCRVTLAKQGNVVRLRGGATSQGNNSGLLKRESFAHGFGQLFVLDFAERRFAKLRKDFGNGGPGSFGKPGFKPQPGQEKPKQGETVVA